MSNVGSHREWAFGIESIHCSHRSPGRHRPAGSVWGRDRKQTGHQPEPDLPRRRSGRVHRHLAVRALDRVDGTTDRHDETQPPAEVRRVEPDADHAVRDNARLALHVSARDDRPLLLQEGTFDPRSHPCSAERHEVPVVDHGCGEERDRNDHAREVEHLQGDRLDVQAGAHSFTVVLRFFLAYFFVTKRPVTASR